MRYQELIRAVSEITGYSQKQVKLTISAFFFLLGSRLLRDGGRVRVSRFGTFRVVERAPRKGRNPRTGEEIQIPARKTIVFRASRRLMEDLR